MACVAGRVPPRAVQDQVQLGIVVAGYSRLEPVTTRSCGAVRRLGVGSMRQGVEAQVRVGELVLPVEPVENVAEAGDVVFVDDGVGRRPAVPVPERPGVQDGVPSRLLTQRLEVLEDDGVAGGQVPPADLIDWTSPGGGGISGVSCWGVSVSDDGSPTSSERRESWYAEMSSM